MNKDKKVELNYNMKLSYKAEWYRYFAEYQLCVDLLFQSICGGQITVISLPLAFLIRHTLEIGYKTNLIELEKVSNLKANIAYHGRSAHNISILHREFELQMSAIFKKYKAVKEIKMQFNVLNLKLVELKKLMNKLDELSYAFRYPVKSDGKTPNFSETNVTDMVDVINFKDIKELYNESIFLLKFSTDVVHELIEGNK